MQPRISILQLNIELDKHLDRVTQFLSEKKPDVACIQELFEVDVPLLEKALGATCVFTPMKRRLVGSTSKVEGLGIFSRLPVRRSHAEYYHGSGLPDGHFDITSLESRNRTQSHALLWCDVEKENTIFTIGTTHFTWTPDGKPDDVQRRDLKNLLELLPTKKDFILCGDFNAPRGGEIFSVLAEKLTDNIPLKYTTSIDGTLHHAGHLEYMVDGIFSTKNMKVTDVERISGLSDHCAFTAFVA